MAYTFTADPLAAISAASRAIGYAQRQRDDEEKWRRYAREDEERELKRAQVQNALQRDAENADLQRAQFAENARRFDYGVQNDAQDRGMRQAALQAQMQRAREGDAADIARQQINRLGNQDKFYADLIERQMMGEQQQLRDAAAADRQAAYAELQGNTSLYGKLLTDELSPHVTAGLQNGSLKYSDWQTAERNKLARSIDEARRDPHLTPAERARFMAQQQQRIYEIDNNPQTVPPDQRPVPLHELFMQETTEIPGLPGRYQRGFRDGRAVWVPVEKPKDQNAEQEQKLDIEARRDQRQEEADARRERREMINDLRDARIAYAKDFAAEEMRKLDLEEPQPTNPKFLTGPPQEGSTTPTTNYEAFNEAVKEWAAKRDAVMARRKQQIDALEASIEQENSAMNPAANISMPAPMSPIGGFPVDPRIMANEAMQAQQQAPIPVASPEDIKAMGLKPGTKIVLPDGRVGTVN